MVIENVKLKDATSLRNIYAHYVLNTSISFEISVPSKSEFLKRIKETTKNFPYIKAVIDGEIVGYAYASFFKKREAYRYCAETSIYVKDGYTKSGIGKALYLALEEKLKCLKIKKLYACITAEKIDGELYSNSIDFHKHMGYKICGTFNDCGFKFNKWYSVVYMEKDL